MKNADIRKLLERYLLGRANAIDNTKVDNWYQSFEEKPVELSPEEAEATGKEIWAKIVPMTAYRPAGDVRAEGEPRAGGAKVRRLGGWMRVAAAAVLLTIAAGAYLWFHPAHTPQFATITTGVGESKKVTLEDGSILTLDAGTTIRVESDGSKDRNVELADGRVFFDVAKDDAHPFVVHSGDLTTTVLGTSFTISAYAGLHQLNVGVVTGRVKVVETPTGVSSGAASAVGGTLAVLGKNEELTYDRVTRTYRTIPLDESMTAWQDGRVLLNDLSFSEMAVVMQKNFGVVITTTQDAVKHTKYTTELLRSMKADEAVQVLAAIHHLKIKKQDNKIFLYQ